MHLVVVDLVPALLSWEGRDRSLPPVVAPDAEEAVSHLHVHYRLIGLTDAGISTLELRDALAAEHLEGYFDSITTSAGLGPTVNPRVIRRLIRPAQHGLVVVTGRGRLAEALSRSRISVVHTEQEDFGGVPEAVAMLIAGRVSP